jgi:hypothetical protein
MLADKPDEWTSRMRELSEQITKDMEAKRFPNNITIAPPIDYQAKFKEACDWITSYETEIHMARRALETARAELIRLSDIIVRMKQVSEEA